ncbi:MAG: hydrogenase/urease maturation nickel metallochaperone HypA [Candidatus Dormibacteria bacterium]
MVGVVEVRIRASPVFSPEALEQAYEMLTAGTPLAGSRLAIEDPPEQRACSRCGVSFTLSHDDMAGHLVLCPSCGEPSALEVGTGIEVLGIT